MGRGSDQHGPRVDELARHLRPSAFPAGGRYENAQDGWSALGGDTERRG